MTIHTFTPRFSAVITKSILREKGRSKRFPGSGGNKVIDITPFLGDECRIFTNKSIYQPMGAFSLAVADRPHPAALDTLYGLLEPMDRIEIRMSRMPHQYAGKQYPIIMRGFIQSISRQESMGDDGKPRRMVIISGRDYGMLFSIIQILNLKAYAEGKALLTGFTFWDKTGLNAQPRAPDQWIKDIIEKIINPFLKGFSEEAQDATAANITPAVSVSEGAIFPMHDFSGPLWGLLTQYADLPWNEMFLRDAEKTIDLVYRPVPYQDLAGEWIPQGKQTIKLPDTDFIRIGMDEIKSLEPSRSDGQVANLFWVDHPTNPLGGGTAALMSEAVQSKDQDTIYLTDPAKYPNCDPDLYGARPMMVTSAHYWTGLKVKPMDLPKSEQIEAKENMLTWMKRRRTDLIALNQDNVVFEEGSMTLRGNENIRVGCYLDVTRGKFKGRYYVHSVIHQFIPYQQYITQVQFIRGTGFLVRSQSDQPYLDEGKPGIYD